MGISVSLPQIETILGIVILVFQIVLILWKVGRKIYDHFKNKQYDKIEEDLNDGISQIEDLKNRNKK